MYMDWVFKYLIKFILYYTENIFSHNLQNKFNLYICL